MNRRECFLSAAAWAFAGHAAAKDDGLAARCRQGGVLLVRHASTEPGIGDPAGFRLGDCRTQRNLSDAGRDESRAMGAWFRQHGLPLAAVRSSQWCRCQDTARIAFGSFEDWPALNSTFGGHGDLSQQLAVLRLSLSRLDPGRLEVWVTHQVIMTGLTGAYPAMAEAFLLDRHGHLQSRGTMRPA